MRDYALPIGVDLTDYSDPNPVSLKKPGCKTTLVTGDWAGMQGTTLFCSDCTAHFGLRVDAFGILAAQAMRSVCGERL